MTEELAADDVLRIVRGMENQGGFSRRKTVWEARRKLRNRELKVGIPRVVENVESRTPWIDEDITKWANRLVGAPIHINVTAKRKGQEERAQAVENFFYRAYHDLKRVRTVGLVFADQRAADHKAGDGLGARHLRLSNDALALLIKGKNSLKALEGGFTGLPFTMEAPDTIGVFYEPDLSLVAEAGSVTYRELHGLYANLGYDQQSRQFVITSETMDSSLEAGVWDQMISVYRLETPEYVYELMEQPAISPAPGEASMLRAYKNPFGRPAYAFDPGRVTSSREPVYAFQPLVAGLYGVVKDWNVLATLQQAAGIFTGLPMYYKARRKGTKGDDVGDFFTLPSGEPQKFEFNLKTGEVKVPDGYEPVAVEFSTGIDLTRAKEDVRWEMQRYSFRDVGEVEATSGYDRARIIESQGYDLQPPLDNQAACWHEVFLLMADAIKHMDVPVTVRTIATRGHEGPEVTVRPKDFEDIDLAVSFSSEGRSAHFAMKESGMREVEMGLKSPTTYLSEDAGRDDPEREWYFIHRDKLRQEVADVVRALFRDTIELVARGEMEEMGILPKPVVAPTEGTGGVERKRPPKGSAQPGVGATLVQPEPPKPSGAPPQEGTKGAAG